MKEMEQVLWILLAAAFGCDIVLAVVAIAIMLKILYDAFRESEKVNNKTPDNSPGDRETVIRGKRFSLRERLFGQRTSPASSSSEPIPHKWGLRDALLKCSTLTVAEVDEYIAYECEGIVYEEVPLDYELEHPEAEVFCLYSDAILQSKTIRRHTNQISPETLSKVQRVLSLIYL